MSTLPIYDHTKDYKDNFEYFKILKEYWHEQWKNSQYEPMPTVMVVLKDNDYVATILAPISDVSTIFHMDVCKAAIDPDDVILSFDMTIFLEPKGKELSFKERKIAKFVKLLYNIKDEYLYGLSINHCDRFGTLTTSMLPYDSSDGNINWKDSIPNMDENILLSLNTIKEIMTTNISDFREQAEKLGKQCNVTDPKEQRLQDRKSVV